jgi:hypothetical protein
MSTSLVLKNAKPHRILQSKIHLQVCFWFVWDSTSLFLPELVLKS